MLRYAAMDEIDAMVPPLEQALEGWHARGWPSPRALVVSGSGLAVDLGEPICGPEPLASLLPFPAHGIEGHPLALEVLEPLAGHPVLYQRGRLHAYQGYSPNQTVFSVRLAALLGARTLVMTNASGGLRPHHRPGDLVLVTDHLNLTGSNPLRGEPPPEWGPRFPDMGAAYDPPLQRLARRVADELGIALGEGVYAGLSGPSYETPAEVAMLRTLGADLAGMSTVLEVIAARHLGVRCLVVSLVSNPAAGVTGEPLDHREVLEAGRAAARDVARLLGTLLREPELYSGGEGKKGL